MTAVRDALVELMRDVSFHDVTVSALARTAHVSRVTFYRHFTTPVDVLEYLCDSLFEEAYREFNEVEKQQSDKYFIHLLKYLMRHSEQLDTIYRSHRTDLFHKSLSKYADDYIPSLSGHPFDDGKEDYVRVAISAAFVGIIFVWTQRGKKETPETLLRIFKHVKIQI